MKNISLFSIFLFGAAFSSSVQAAPLPQQNYKDIKIYTKNSDAFFGKDQLARTTESGLDMTYFIIDDDATTSRFFLNLIKRIEEKKSKHESFKVRILVDYFMSEEQIPFLLFLKSYPEIEVRRYNPPDPNWIKLLVKMGIEPDLFVRGLMSQKNDLLKASAKNLRVNIGGKTVPLREVLAKSPLRKSKETLPLVRLAYIMKLVQDKVINVAGFLEGLEHFLSRTHHKLIIKDKTCFQMGGRNLSDEYHASRPDILIEGGFVQVDGKKVKVEERRYPFMDIDVEACEVGSHFVQNGFNTLWDSPLSVDLLKIPLLLPQLKFASIALTKKQVELEAKKAAHYPDFEESPATIKLEQATGILAQNLPPLKSENRQIAESFIERLGEMQSGDEADFVNAYFYLDNNWPEEKGILNKIHDAFLQAKLRGVKTRVFTNSDLTTDLAIVNTMGFAQYEPLINAPGPGTIEIFELSPDLKASLHRKMALYRSQQKGKSGLSIGSGNLDPRSELGGGDTNNVLHLFDPLFDEGSDQSPIKALLSELNASNKKKWRKVDSARLEEIKLTLDKIDPKTKKFNQLIKDHI